MLIKSFVHLQKSQSSLLSDIQTNERKTNTSGPKFDFVTYSLSMIILVSSYVNFYLGKQILGILLL